MTTFWPREDIWDTLKMPRPTTWSTWEVTTDVSWLLSRSPCLRRTFISRIQEKQDTMEYDEHDQAEKPLKPWSLSSKKIQGDHWIFLQKKPPQIMHAAQAGSEARKAQAKEKNAAAAGTICENAEAKKEEVERMCKGNIMSESVVTANETDGWHRGRAILSAASEDGDHIEFNNDHVKGDMTERKCELSRSDRWRTSWSKHSERRLLTTWRRQKKLVGGIVDVLYSAQWNEEDDFTRVPQRSCRAQYRRRHGKETKHSQEGSESSSTETTSAVAMATARMSGDEHSDFHRVTCQQQHERS